MSETFELFKDEMQNDDISIRVNTIHRLKIVLTLSNVDQIQSQLINYLDNLIKKEDDEVLFALAEELGNVFSMLPNCQNQILSFLENLASVEETVVRNQAVNSLNLISAKLGQKEIAEIMVPMILKLANNDTNFTLRVSAINLMHVVYPKSGDLKQKIREKFYDLGNEETPMVKRAVAQKIGDFAINMSKESFLYELIPLFRKLSSDEQDLVRVICLENLKQLAQLLNKDENKTHMLPVIIAAAEDKSWRVKFALSKNFAELTEAFGKEITDNSLIQIITTLLKDPENEVKCASVKSLGQFIKQLSNEKIQLIIPHVFQLAKDSNAQVRAGISRILGSISSILSKDQLGNRIYPFLQEMFNDVDVEVRIAVINAMGKFVVSAGIESANLFVNNLKQSINDPKWRVRMETIDIIVEISQNFSSTDIFVKQLESLFFQYLKDRVSQIREFGTEKLKTLVKVYGNDWVLKNLLPKLNEILQAKECSYLNKMTAIYSLQAVGESLNPDLLSELILPTLFKFAKDPVPNVRFVVAKIFKSLSKEVTKSNQINNVKSCLQEMVNDQDKEVQFYSKEALSLY